VPECLGAPGYRSVWYWIRVAEPSVLRVTVRSDPLAYLPVVTILAAAGAELSEQACAVGAAGAQSGGTVTATAYVRPEASAPGRYLVRVAQVSPLTPGANGPAVQVAVSGQDVTPPSIRVRIPSRPGLVGETTQYDARGSTDAGADIDWASERWTFEDGRRTQSYSPPAQNGRPQHPWRTPGLHTVTVSVADRAGNRSTYTFFALVRDPPPTVAVFGVRSVPFPGARRLTLVVAHDETVRVRVRVRQGARRLLSRTLTFWGRGRHTRRVGLRLRVAARPSLVLSGVARDSAGNRVTLPVCLLDARTGGGRCFRP
jgi:hypothetical protein